MAASPFAAAAALGPIGSFEPFTHDENRQALTDLFTTRSLQHSEAQLLQRCSAAVEQCRRDLQDLRAACKAANSHREKCAELLGAATEAVVALEDMLYDPNIDMQLERSLQQLSSRVQTALDKGEAVVRVYGSMNGIMKLASRMCSPGTGYKFDDAIKDLTTLAKQARMQRQPGPRFSTGPSSATGGMDGRSSAPATTAAVTPNAMTPAVSNSNQSTVLPFGSAPISSPTGRGSGPSSTAPSGLPPLDEVSVQLPPLPLAQGSGQAFMVGDRQVPEEAMHWQKVRKGGSRQAITAMVHVPPREVGHLGRLWYYLSKSVFSSGSLFIVDLSSGVDVEVKEARSDKTFTCMHLDDASNFIWTGHSNGHIRVWDAEKQEALLDGVKVFGHPVSTITTDELGRCWVGGDKGRIKSYKLEWSEQSGVALGWKLVLRGELNVVSDGIPEPDWEPVVGDGMTWHPLANESAHYGPVRTIAAAAGRVWTCGGSSAFAVLKEWTPDGILVDTHSMRSMEDSPGLINHMVVVSPIAIVQESQRQRNTGSQSQALSSFTTTTSLAIASRAPATVLVEVDMPWQLLTAHDNGVVQVWGYIDVNRALVPLVRIGDRVAPALRIVVCEPLGSIITTHNDGKVRVRPIHHPRSARGLKIVYQEGSVSTIREVNMPSVQLDTSRSGLSSALGGRIGVVTASNSATIKLWPVAELRRLAEDGSVDVQGAMAEPAQWPVFQFTPFGLKQYLEEQLLAQQQMSMEYDTSIDDDARRSSRGAMEAFEQVVFGEENNRWQIDWKDLTRTRIIGEGAFGKVWLGRWQETDVAIKQLGSLSALGVETGSIQHDSTGGLKLNKEVQRALEKEVGLLKEMRHPNIILFMGVVLDPAAVVTEYCARGSLYDLLQEAREKPALKRALDWPRRVVMALDAAKGMLYLHGHKPAIIHRDLKSPNLLVEKNWKVKVTDFNLSKATQASQNNVMSSIQAINPRWQPPEVILRQEYTKASDVYAFGLILWELLTWELPFQNMSVLQIMLNITQQNARPPVPDQYGASALPGGTFSGYDEYVGLMRRCWAEDPEARPTFEKVIADLRKVANILSEARDAATLRPSLGTAHSRNMSRQSMAAILAAGPAAGAPARVPSPPPAAAIAVPAAAAADNSIDVLAAMTAQLDSAYREGQSQGHPSVRSDGGSERGNISTQVSQVSYAATSWGGTSPSLAGAASGASVISTPVPVMSPFDASGPFGSGGTSSGGTGAFGGSVGGAPPAAALQAAALLASGGAVPTDGVSASAGSPQTSWYGGVGAGPFSASAGSPQASWYGAGAAPVPGQTVSSAGPPPPSPFGGGADVSIGLVVSSAGAPPPSPFGDGVQGLRGQTVSSAGPPPPSPFGGDASLPGQTVSSAGPPPPSPFGGDASLPGQTVSSAGPPPPSPFGGNPSLPGQTVSSAGPPPPSPFGGGTAAPGGQHISSAAPAPPSPFGDVASVGGGQAVSSAAAPPPSPFGDAPAAGGGQAISSAAPPPPSPFGDGGFSVPPMLAAAQPPSAASSDAGTGAPRLGRLSPYAARSPRSGSPANRAQLDAASLPPTVLEATPSMERTAAAAGGSPLAAAAPQDSKSSGGSSSNNRNSQLVDSALTADAGRVPRSSGSSGGTAATGDEAAAGGGAEAQDGGGLQSRPSAKPGVLQRLLSGGGRRARLP